MDKGYICAGDHNNNALMTSTSCMNVTLYEGIADGEPKAKLRAVLFYNKQPY